MLTNISWTSHMYKFENSLWNVV